MGLDEGFEVCLSDEALPSDLVGRDAALLHERGDEAEPEPTYLACLAQRKQLASLHSGSLPTTSQRTLLIVCRPKECTFIACRPMAGGKRAEDTSARAVFGANVRRVRAERGYSQEELAERSGLHRTYVSSLERGQRNVGLDNIVRLADTLGTSAAVLLDGI